MEIYFTGGKKVAVKYKGFVIETDQPTAAGGEGRALSPFDLFVASFGACAGFYVLSFCQGRGIPAQEIKLTLSTQFDPESHLINQVDIRLALPATFPEKYKVAVVKAADKCTVKKHLEQPPEITVSLL